MLDAYIWPLIRSYIGELENRLVNEGFSGPFCMIRSGAGAMTADRARDAPGDARDRHPYSRTT